MVCSIGFFVATIFITKKEVSLDYIEIRQIKINSTNQSFFTVFWRENHKKYDMLAHHLVEVVVLVGILFALSWTALLQQVAQRIVGVGIGEGIVGIDLQPAGAAGEPV